jgi:hypothetical protein
MWLLHRTGCIEIMPEQFDSTPQGPDPSSLTTSQLLREISSLYATVDARLTGMQILHGEKFDNIQLQFRERDVRHENATAAANTSIAKIHNQLDSQKIDDRIYVDTKVQDLRDLKTHDLIGVERRFQLSNEHIAAEFTTQHEFFTTKVNDLRELMEQRFLMSKEAVTDSIQNAKEAVTKAEDATERRFASVNEFRSTLSDQAAQLMPRAEAQTRFETLQTNVARIELDLRGSVSNAGGRSVTSTQFVTAGLAIAAIIVALGVGMLNVSHQTPTTADEKRGDDFIARMDAISRRLDTIPTSPH